MGAYYYFYQVFKNKAEAISSSQKKKGHSDGTAGMFSWLVVAAIVGAIIVLLTIPIWVLVTRMQVPDKAVTKCTSCAADFSAFNRKAEVSQRLTNAKERANVSTTVHSLEELARKLQEELERNRKSSIGSKSSVSSGKQTREVACPICTVYLQVQVPASGSETIECGVCQQPFLVSAR